MVSMLILVWLQFNCLSYKLCYSPFQLHLQRELQKLGIVRDQSVLHSEFQGSQDYVVRSYLRTKQNHRILVSYYLKKAQGLERWLSL